MRNLTKAGPFGPNPREVLLINKISKSCKIVINDLIPCFSRVKCLECLVEGKTKGMEKESFPLFDVVELREDGKGEWVEIFHPVPPKLIFPDWEEKFKRKDILP